MGYRGDTFRLPFDRGGLNHNKNIDNIPAEMMVHPSRNVNLHEGGRGKRGGTAHVDAAVMSGAPRIMGVYDFTLENGNQFIIRVTGDGKIYKDDTNTIKASGFGANKVADFSSYNDLVYICNGNIIPQTWDGSAGTTSDMAAVPADWSGSNFPKQIIIHGSYNSTRGWALGLPSNPNNIYVTPDAGSGDLDFDNGTILNFYIDTGDGKGIVGGKVFGDRIFLFGKTRTYYMIDTDTDDTKWYYREIQGSGGAAHHRLIVETPNDIVCMMEDGEIYSVTAVQAYGDYKKASLTRPAFIDRWIQEHIKLSAIDDFHAVYDPTLRAIKFFMVRNGQTNVDMALVYFIDRPPEEAWIPHDNQSSNSGYSASCSTLVRVGDGDYQVYTGDYSGFIWKLEQANRNDNNDGYYAGCKTPRITFDNPRITKNYKRGWGVTQAQGDYNLNIKIWVDGVEQTARTISLVGVGGTLPFTLGADLLGGDEMIDKLFEIGSNGKRIQLEFFNSNADEDFFISQALIDHKNLGSRLS